MSKKDKWWVVLSVVIIAVFFSILAVLFVPHYEYHKVAFYDIRVNEEAEPYLFVSYYADGDMRKDITKGLGQLTEFERAYIYGSDNLSIKRGRVIVKIETNKVGNVSFCLIGE